MTRIIEKRRSLHRQLANQAQKNDDLQYQLGQLQALANIGVSTCMIAHEINNLLTGLPNYASMALNNPDDTALAEKVFQKTMRNCRRASKIMKSILAVANGESKEKKNTPLVVLVEDIFSCLCRDFSKDGIAVKIQIPESLVVWAVPVEIQQVMMNLILNSREAMLESGGTLTINAEDKSEAIVIEISDNGPGIEPVNLSKVFEAFFSTKADGAGQSSNGGCGLGLCFCKKIVEEHKGRISVESIPGERTTFKIILPKPAAVR